MNTVLAHESYTLYLSFEQIYIRYAIRNEKAHVFKISTRAIILESILYIFNHFIFVTVLQIIGLILACVGKINGFSRTVYVDYFFLCG